MWVLFFIWKMQAADQLPLCRPYDRREQAPALRKSCNRYASLEKGGRIAVRRWRDCTDLPYLFHKPVDGIGQFGEHFRIAVLHGVNDTVLQVVLEDHLAGAV